MWLCRVGRAGDLLARKKMHNTQMWKLWDWEMNKVKLQEKQKGWQRGLQASS